MCVEDGLLNKVRYSAIMSKKTSRGWFMTEKNKLAKESLVEGCEGC